MSENYSIHTNSIIDNLNSNLSKNNDRRIIIRPKFYSCTKEYKAYIQCNTIIFKFYIQLLLVAICYKMYTCYIL